MECESSVSPAYDLAIARVAELAYALVLETSVLGLEGSNLSSSTWYRRLTVRTSGFQPGNGGFNSPRYHKCGLTDAAVNLVRESGETFPHRTYKGRLTQLGECLPYKQKAAGSSPAVTTRSVGEMVSRHPVTVESGDRYSYRPPFKCRI